jgi:hypothetical protein
MTLDPHLTPAIAALCAALMLCLASAAQAAPRRAIRHHAPAVTHHIARRAYRSYAAAAPTGDYTFIAPNHALTPAGNILKCWGGSCSPDWQAWEDAQ